MRILLEGFLAGFGPGVLRTPGQGQVAALRAHSYRLAKHPLLAAYPSSAPQYFPHHQMDPSHSMSAYGRREKKM